MEWTAYLLQFLSVSAVVSTVGFFCCGIPICMKIKSLQSTVGISAIPFTFATLNCVFWLRYGMLKEDNSIITVNMVGLLLEISYLVCYWYFAENKNSVNRQILLVLTLSSAMLAYIHFESALSRMLATYRLGLMCVVLTILTFGAPLAQVRDVIRTKSTTNLPFPLCAAALIVTFQWTLYGILIDDSFVAIPNGLAGVVSVVQMSLFAVYPKGSSTVVRQTV